MLLDTIPLVLDIVLGSTAAIYTAHADTVLPAPILQAVQNAALNILALRIDPQPFTALAENDTLFGSLVQARPYLRIIQSATVFEALSWAIIGQQINLPFAIALRRMRFARQTEHCPHRKNPRTISAASDDGGGSFVGQFECSMTDPKTQKAPIVFKKLRGCCETVK